MATVLKFQAATNRGLTTYVISKTDKGYFAHELGELTQWGKVFNTGELKAHRLNPSKRYGNQYGSYLKPAPVSDISAAFDLCRKNAGEVILRY